jgi:C1A family cysteine protease
MTRLYGWKKQQPDHRDWKFVPVKVVLPSWVDLRANSGCPPIYDQGQLGSCTANAGVGSIGMLMIKERLPRISLSRLDLYWYERVLEGTTDQDSGASIRDSMKASNKYGVCYESLWPYDISTFTNPPTPAMQADAAKHKLKSYLAVGSVQDMKASLALGFPVVFGISVYESFESSMVDATGMVPIPKTTEQYLGGHALCAVGYRDSTQRIIFRNSWGTGWGDKGYGYIPYSYLSNLNLAADFWTPRLF